QGVGKIWNFNASANEWQPFTEQPIEQMRRQSTSTALLLIEYPLFLRCSNQTELSKACYNALTRIDSDILTQIYGPYQFTGLARMDYRTDGRNFRTQSAIALTGEVLAHVVAQSEHLKSYFYRSGSPLETVLAMANLDPKAFGLDGKDYLARPVALKLLGDFWKRMGKNRPVGLLGDIYAKGIYAGLASIGESAPERSSLVSIHLTNVLGRSLFGDGEGKGTTDLLTVLMLADQIRLMELLELSWTYAEAVLNDLRTVASLQEIGELIRLGGTFAQHEVEIAKRFNQKWISATQPLWTILRGSAPHAWGFWTKIAEGYSIAQLLVAYEPAQALGYFLMPLADITRLMLLFETSSPVLSEKLKTDSETAARSLLSGFERFKSWQAPLSNIIEEALGYYFDLTIQHDAWVSFTESLKHHLRLLDTDLQSRQAPEAIITMLSTVLVRLEANHPTPQLMQYDSPPEVVVSSQTKLPFCDFADSDCQFLQHLSRDLLGEKILNQAIVLKTISLWRNSDLRESLRNISYFANILSGLILDETLRAMLISSPLCIQACGQILQGLKEDSSDLGDQAINDILNTLRNHREAQQKVESVLAIPSFPFDEDRQHLSELSVKTDGEKVEMMLVAVFSTPCLVIVTKDNGTVGTLSKLEAELSYRLQARLAEFELEIMPLGGISLSASEAGLSLSSSSLEVDPIFYESSKQASARMLWSFASNKMALASKILQEELRDSMIALKL
ncbi:MAG: hypothetical protein JNN15_18720, partial [Blastocatellia bacterium]|nr:hypothetical protein [Blastocatellia bacterium]